MRDRQFPATAPIAPESARIDVRSGRPDARVASTLAIAMMLAVVTIGDANARSRVTIDDSVLESLGPEPTIASLMLRPPRGMAGPTRPSAQPAPRAVAQAPSTAPRSRLLLPGGAPATASPFSTPLIAAAPALRLPPMTALAAAPSVRPAPAEIPRSRVMTPPSLAMAPVLRPPAPEPTPAAEPVRQLAVAPILAPALLPTPPVAPLASGVRAAPSQLPRSQLLLPPSLGERPPIAPAPVLPVPVAAAPAPSSSWPSLAGTAIAAPLPPSVALPAPVSPALVNPAPAQQVAAAAPTARDIQPPAPLSVPAVAPSAVPSASAARPQVVLSRLLFQRGTLDPADGSREALARLAEQLVATPSRRIEIQAYAAGSGNETENSNEARRMSLDRALAVRSGLVQRGVQSNRVTVRSLGNIGGEGPPDRVDIVLLSE